MGGFELQTSCFLIGSGLRGANLVFFDWIGASSSKPSVFLIGSGLRAANLVFFGLDRGFELQASCFSDWIGASSCKPRVFLIGSGQGARGQGAKGGKRGDFRAQDRRNSMGERAKGPSA